MKNDDNENPLPYLAGWGDLESMIGLNIKTGLVLKFKTRASEVVIGDVRKRERIVDGDVPKGMFLHVGNLRKFLSSSQSWEHRTDGMAPAFYQGHIRIWSLPNGSIGLFNDCTCAVLYPGKTDILNPDRFSLDDLVEPAARLA